MEKLSGWSQIAKDCGINEDLLKSMAHKEGLTDEHGALTRSALEEGVFILINQGMTTITAEKKQKVLFHPEFENNSKKAYGERGNCILIRIASAKNLNIAEERVVFVHTSVIF
jgi:hypothetical protein